MEEDGARRMPDGDLTAYRAYLVLDGKSDLTIQKYLRDVGRFRAYLGRGIRSGRIFVTKNGRPGWGAEKLFPQNLRHLFAGTFYDRGEDIVRLADVLGRRRVDTTCIHTTSGGGEHAHLPDALRLLPRRDGCA